MKHITLSRVEKSVAVLLVLMLAIGAANLVVTVRYFTSLQTRTLTMCAFMKDIGSAPISPAPGSKVPISKFGVTILSDARLAWQGLDCPGKLPPPSPTFVHWANVYHIAHHPSAP